MNTIYLGAGGFWTTEAIYRKVKGVEEVLPGYMGGTIPYPTHEAVATGTTGHAEVVRIVYDPTVIPTEDILRIFFAMHDASAPNHAINGVGSQYRSVIFYTDSDQGEAVDPQNGAGVGLIEKLIAEIQQSLPEGVVVATQAVSATEFYPADEMHYNYYELNKDSSYVQEAIEPKIQLIAQLFPDKL
ncbi:MAG: peptide-methionine (S)-S-oxide reductase MsrA [Patescibacteria group bacterium]